MKQNKIYSIIFILILLIAGFALAYAQECRIQKANADGSYTVIIGGAILRAITAEQQKKILADEHALTGANKRIEELNAVIESMQTIQKKQEEQISDLQALNAKQKEYADKLETANKKCEDLVRSLGGKRKFTLDAGIGITRISDDYKAAFMLGAGYGIFRVWGFAQSGNKGVLAGVSYPLF